MTLSPIWSPKVRLDQYLNQYPFLPDADCGLWEIGEHFFITTFNFKSDSVCYGNWRGLIILTIQREKLYGCLYCHQSYYTGFKSSKLWCQGSFALGDVLNEWQCGRKREFCYWGWTVDTPMNLKHTCYDFSKVEEKESLGSSLEVVDLLPGTAYTLLLWRENRWTF